MSPAKQKSAGKSRSSGKAAASGDGKAPAAGKEKGMPQSAAMPSPFPPIADYAFLSNCHTGALVAPDGGVGWLCVPRFDSPSIFGTLLDREAGSFRFGPFGINVPSNRIYEPGTNILNTTWHTPTGWAMVRDALTIGPTQHEDEVTPHTRAPADEDAHHMLVRTVLCMEGSVDMELHCEPDFDYGRTPADWSLQGPHTADASGAGLTVRLRSSIPLGAEAEAARARHTLQKGEQAFCSLSWAEELASPEDIDQANARMSETANYWRTWISKARMPDHRFREAIQRSALAIKGLTYMPTGATVAALTTSLPETPGGERNWDYRFTWIRDSTFTLQALHYLDLDWEANEFMQFIGDLEPNEDGGLQIMYGIDGRRDLTESTRDDLSGYAGASPVRVGNGAFDQRQNDVFGAALDSILLHTNRSQRLPRRLWPVVQAQAECATKVWKKPDQGIWEARGKPQQYVSSKLMCWVAMDRASQLAEIRGDSDLQAEWSATAEEIRKDILENGVRDGVLRQHYDTDALDASTLLAALFGFLPGDDEVLRKSVLAIADDLTEDGFVLRYVTGQTDDGLSGKEGSFLICSFWLVSGLAIIREHQRARDLMDRLLRIASPLGLYAEEFDPSTGRLPGEFPPGLLPPRPDRGRRRGSSSASASRSSESTYERLRRDRDRQRGWGRDARPQARRLRQEDPSAGARGLPDSRAAELAGRGRLRRRPLPVGGHLVRRQGQGVRPAGALLRRRRDQDVRRGALPPARRGLRRGPATRMASRRPGPSPTTRWSPTTRRRRSSTRCTVLEARTPRSPRQALPIPSRPSPTSRASSSSRTISPPPATGPSTLPAG